MKYFEFDSPYWALIAAENEDLAIKEYSDTVCDVDWDDEDLDFVEVTEEYAKEKYKASRLEYENLTITDEQFYIDSSHQNTLLIDNSLV